MSRQALRELSRALRAGGARALTSGTEPLLSARAGEAMLPISDKHNTISGVIDVPGRLLMGPGPANAHPRVLAAQTLPLLGHMHPPFLKIMDEIQEGLRYVFQTDSKYTLCVSGTGHSGMEAAVANLLEPGEKIIVGNKGIWGQRVCDLAARYGGEVINMEKPAGQTFALEEMKALLQQHRPVVLFLCQGESSAGTHQNLAGLGSACRETGTLLLVDTVCSLGGVPLFADEWGIDCIYSGSQKVLAAPSGAAPLMLNQRALDKLHNRRTKVASYYLDLTLVGDYWGWYDKRWYHHTAPISTFYAMREALAVVGEEGLEKLWKRHEDMHVMLWDGLKKMGLESFVEKDADRLATVNTIKVPEGVDAAALIGNAMSKFQVEIAGGLGPTVGKVWRVGVMGYNAKPQNVQLVLDAFRDGLQQQGRL